MSCRDWRHTRENELALWPYQLSVITLTLLGFSSFIALYCCYINVSTAMTTSTQTRSTISQSMTSSTVSYATIPHVNPSSVSGTSPCLDISLTTVHLHQDLHLWQQQWLVTLQTRCLPFNCRLDCWRQMWVSTLLCRSLCWKASEKQHWQHQHQKWKWRNLQRLRHHLASQAIPITSDAGIPDVVA